MQLLAKHHSGLDSAFMNVLSVVVVGRASGSVTRQLNAINVELRDKATNRPRPPACRLIKSEIYSEYWVRT